MKRDVDVVISLGKLASLQSIAHMGTSVVAGLPVFAFRGDAQLFNGSLCG